MAAAIVQFASGRDISSVTFGAAPTNGNWLIAICTHWNNNPVPSGGSGWSQQYNENGVTMDGTAVFFKKAGAGESATQTPFVNGSQNPGVVYEVSGLTGTWVTDFQQKKSEFDLTCNPSYTTTSFNTSAANTMVLGYLGALVGTGVTEVAPTVTAGQTDDATVLDNTGGNRHAAGKAFHQFFAANTSPVQYTGTWAVNQTKGAYALVAMNWTAAAALTADVTEAAAATDTETAAATFIASITEAAAAVDAPSVFGLILGASVTEAAAASDTDAGLLIAAAVGAEAGAARVLASAQLHADIPSRWLLRTGHMDTLGECSIDDTRLTIKRGIGNNISAPMIWLRANKDNQGFGRWVKRSLGRAGDRRTTLNFGGFGSAYTWQFEIACFEQAEIELVGFDVLAGALGS